MHVCWFRLVCTAGGNLTNGRAYTSVKWLTSSLQLQIEINLYILMIVSPKSSLTAATEATSSPFYRTTDHHLYIFFRAFPCSSSTRQLNPISERVKSECTKKERVITKIKNKVPTSIVHPVFYIHTHTLSNVNCSYDILMVFQHEIRHDTWSSSVSIEHTTPTRHEPERWKEDKPSSKKSSKAMVDIW